MLRLRCLCHRVLVRLHGHLTSRMFGRCPPSLTESEWLALDVVRFLLDLNGYPSLPPESP